MRPNPARGRLPGAGLLLLPAAAIVVHQLRYMLAYGSHAGAELTAQGHSYTTSLVPWLLLALGGGLTAYLRRAAHALRTGETGTFSRRSAAVLWGATAVALVAIYALQESLEELFATGHPGGLAGVFGHGGWWAAPAAAVVAAGVVGLLRLGRSFLRAVGRLAPRGPAHADSSATRPVRVALIAFRPLASSAAGRAPPGS